MSRELTPQQKEGFKPLTPDENMELVEKEQKAIARLWNDGDGKKENKNWAIKESSGKGFYDSQGEFIVLNKQTNILYLCSAHTNYGGHSWKSPDYIRIRATKKAEVDAN